MEAEQIYSSDINDIIFERRNKAYGAYDIRKTYWKNVRNGMILATSVLLLAVFGPVIWEKIKPAPAPLPETEKVVTINELEAPPPLDETKPPPPPPDIPPPPEKIIQFVPPKVVKEEVNDEPPPTIQEIKTTTTGNTNVEGETKLEDVPPPVHEEIKPDKPDEVYEFVDQYPEFPGGYDKYIQSHLEYPSMAAETNTQGTVLLKVTIGGDGTVKNVDIIKDIGAGCGAEAVRVVKNMPPWKPGKQNGNPVTVKFVVPVKFVLK